MTTATHPPHFQRAHTHQIKFATVVSFLTGTYMFIVSFMAAHTPAGRITGCVLGALVVVLSAMLYGGAVTPRANWVNALIGVWFVASPWILRFTDSQPWTLNAIVVGAIILVCSAWSGAASRGESRHA
jgi:multisubunit Na+/H+ antiporter MnhB subunit